MRWWGVTVVESRHCCVESDAGKIPGFPPHLSSLYIPQEVVPEGNKTPFEYLLSHHEAFIRQTKSANSSRIEQLEEELEQLDMTSEKDAEKMESICEEISRIGRRK